VQAESRSSGSDSPPSSFPKGSIPDYLEPFIVDQDMSRYSAIDQAVWRFVLLQLHARLARTAHPSYVRGLAESGISSEHIPSIGEMNRRLEAIGWRAVCVDGFIPPRAFTAFQALGVLPIAAEIRTPDHLRKQFAGNDSDRVLWLRFQRCWFTETFKCTDAPL